MKSTMIALIAAATMGLALTAAAQAPAARIVTVDLNKIFNEFYKTPIASAKLKETVESFNKEQEEMVGNYKKAIDELNKLRDEQDKPEYSAEIREQKHKAVADKLADTQKLQRDIEEYRASHRKILEDQTQRMRQTILKEVQDVINKKARDDGYQMVLDKSGNTLNGVPIMVFSQDSLEITDDIIKDLNKNQPKTTETPKPADKKDDKKGDKK
jgi:outer membrane protein